MAPTFDPPIGRLNAPNREAWLAALVEGWRPLLTKIGTLPAIRISCGFPSRNALARKRLALGQCWSQEYSEDGSVQVFISPLLDDPFEVAHVTLHELVHAVVGCKHGHRGPFRRAIRRIGLTGKPTSTIPNDALAAHIRDVLLIDLGPYPHARINSGPELGKEEPSDPFEEPKGLKTRLIKVICDDCGYIARVSRRWIIHPGPPICPCNHNRMRVEPKHSRNGVFDE